MAPSQWLPGATSHLLFTGNGYLPLAAQQLCLLRSGSMTEASSQRFSRSDSLKAPWLPGFAIPVPGFGIQAGVALLQWLHDCGILAAAPLQCLSFAVAP